MKKDLLKAIIALVLCLVVVVVSYMALTAYISCYEAKDYTVSCEEYGYVTYWDKREADEGTTILIKTYDEYNKWKEEILNAGSTAKSYKEKLESYDEAFFEDNDLIMEYYVLTSGSYKMDVKRLDVKDGVADVVTKKKTPVLGGHTDDMAYWAAFIQVNKAEGIKSCRE